MSVALIIYYSDNSSSEYRLFILMIALKRIFKFINIQTICALNINIYSAVCSK